MKNKSNSLLFIASAFMLFLASCAPEDPAGIDNLSGTWVTNESSQVFGNTAYTVEISESPTAANQINIKNFYNLGLSATAFANVNGSTIDIPAQNVAGQQIEGSGSLQGSTVMNIEYRARDGQAVDTVVTKLTKK